MLSKALTSYHLQFSTCQPSTLQIPA
jgi:hypothetical protein